MAASGLTDQAISIQLGISLATVATYWGRIRIKMGPLSRPELVANWVSANADVKLTTLRAENAALVEEIEAYRTRETTLEDALATIRSLVEMAPEAVLFVDQDGCIIEANARAADLFGCTLDDFRGTRVGRFIPASLHERHRMLREQFFAAGGRVEMGDHAGVAALRADGSEIRILASVSAVETPAGRVAVLIARRASATSD